MNLYLFSIINSLSQYNIINYISVFLSYVFVYIIPFILIIWILFYEKRKMFSFSILFLSSFSTWFVAQFIKNITMISRPIIQNPIISEIGSSFPSQHAAVTMVIGVVIFSLNKALGWIFIFISLLVGISRIILGVHYPLDIIAGWVLGVLLGILFIKLFKKL